MLIRNAVQPLFKSNLTTEIEYTYFLVILYTYM